MKLLIGCSLLYCPHISNPRPSQPSGSAFLVPLTPHPTPLTPHPPPYTPHPSPPQTQVLVRRAGHPAALAIILHDVLQRLLIAGEIDFAALVSLPPDWEGLPRVTPLPNLTRAVVMDPNRTGAVLNVCSSEVRCGCLGR